jgi:hypothetical protein
LKSSVNLVILVIIAAMLLFSAPSGAQLDAPLSRASATQIEVERRRTIRPILDAVHLELSKKNLDGAQMILQSALRAPNDPLSLMEFSSRLGDVLRLQMRFSEAKDAYRMQYMPGADMEKYNYVSLMNLAVDSGWYGEAVNLFEKRNKVLLVSLRKSMNIKHGDLVVR